MASQQQSQAQPGSQTAGHIHSPGARDQRGPRSSRRKGSDSSVPEEEKERREEPGRGEGTGSFTH